MKYNKYQLKKGQLLELYRQILYPRMVEEKMLLLLRKGKISKWFSGIGQEAISVGCANALKEDDQIFTLHRNLGIFTSRKVPLKRLFAQWQARAEGFTNGRDRSFHFGAPEYGIIGMISHLGPQLSVACGVALSNKLKSNGKVVLAFTGEGGTSQGEFHEALNVASVWKLPVIFVVENNGYGLSTPSSDQFKCKHLASKAKGYGMKSKILEGNNLLAVYSKIKQVASEIRKKPAPYLIECKTFRMRGHEETSGNKYVPKQLLDHWAKKDPLKNYENYLLKKGCFKQQDIDDIKSEFSVDIDLHISESLQYKPIEANYTTEINDVYKNFEFILTKPNSDSLKNMRFLDAIKDGLDKALSKHDNLIFMGQDIAEYGGVFKMTEGFVEKYGKKRIRNTPLCESAIIGISLGLSIEKMKAMVEMQFADFVTCGFNQIVNNLAKIHYRWGQNADVVIRMPTGAGMAAGPFHSQSNEAWFAHTPGLKIVYPSNPVDAKGLILASFEDPNPVLFFEHKALYRKISADVPTDYYTIEIGKATIAREGNQLTIITYGMGVHWAMNAVEEQGVDAEIIDLRSLLPIDYVCIETSIKKTSRVLILHEDTKFGGIGAEISAYISENLFEFLDAPVLRVASLNTPIPFAEILEKQFLANARLDTKLKDLVDY